MGRRGELRAAAVLAGLVLAGSPAARADAPSARTDTTPVRPDAPAARGDASARADTSAVRRAGEPLDAVRAALAAQYPTVFGAPARFRVQVLLTEPTDDGALARHGYRVDAEYFYPASAIKLAAAVAALEKVEELGATPVAQARFFGASEADPPEPPTTVAFEVRKALIGSDNDAFNRLYTFVGQRELAGRLARLALPTARVAHRLGFLQPGMDDGRVTPRVDVALPDGKVATVPRRTAGAVFDEQAVPGTSVGAGYLESGKLVPQPMSFAARNRMGLRDLQDLLMAVVRPELVRPEVRPRFDDVARDALVAALATPPKDSKAPAYDPAQYPDLIHKPTLVGASKVLPKERLEVLSKGGRAYGFTVENAYVRDTKTGRSFFLAAAIYTNSSEILNNDLYEYGVATGVLVDLAEHAARQIFVERKDTSPPDAPLDDAERP